MANVAKGIRCTLNPDPTHFVYNWVKPFLDEEGYPVKEICGKTRYYVIYRGILYTDWSSENLKTQFGKNPQTYTYIPSLLTDNEEVLRANPDYADILDSMPERKRKQLLLGCWKQDDDSGVMFDRKWLLGNNGERAVKAEDIPIGSLCYRGIDKAYSTPHETHRYPDFTAISPKIYKTPDGRYILAGDYHEDIIDVRSPWDNEDPVIGRIRKLPGSRDDLIVKQAHMDGRDVTYVLSKDNGGGAADYLTTVGRLIEIGTRVKADQTPKNTPGKKVKDFEDFSAASEAGLVYIAIDTFNPKTLEAILAELESFNGEKSNHRKKDD